MTYLVNVQSAVIEAGRRLIKTIGWGNDDVQTPTQAAPAGMDSNPIKGMTAVYSTTGDVGENVIVGYLNKNQVAAPGEVRLFATDEQGNVKIYTWLKADGTMELAGNTDNLVRFKPLDELVTNINTFLNEQLTLIQTGITGVGGAYAKGTAQFTINTAKVEELKTT